MDPELLKAYNFLKSLRAGWTVVAWLSSRWRKFQEDMVLSTFPKTDPDEPWQSAHGVVGELYLKASLSDAPGYFLPQQPTFRDRFCASFYRIRHFFRRVLLIPNKNKVDRILRRLCFERKVLARANWSLTGNEVYKMRTSLG